MIHVLATIELRPGVRDAFLEEFRRIVPLVRAESGCIEYVPTVDVDTGLEKIAPPRPDEVTVVEKWESVSHLEAHLASAHMAEYRERVRGLVVKSTVRVTEPA
ncbi:MAG TPA: putative quinol monooxygenase [Planctomycetota bacterium]|nr:putative quinol monooxygenase [Planctomycetota bacterium]